MKTVINAKSARTAVKFVSGIIRRKTVLPILSNVHCAANGHFEITATDLDVTLRAEFPCQSTVDGQTTLPAAALVDACAGNADFELETSEKHVTAIRAGGNIRNVNGLAPAEFPKILDIPADARVLVFPAAEFVAALKSVAVAQSIDASRHVINGVCVDISAEGVRLVATDGRRLHLAQLGGNGAGAAEKEKINAVQLAVTMAERDLQAAKELYVPIYQAVTEGEHKGYFKQIAAQEVRDAQEVLERAQGILAKMTAGAHILLPSIAVKHILRLPIDKKAPGEITLRAFDLIIAKPGAEQPDRTPQAAIEYGAYRIVTKQIEGNYPCYRQVIPRANGFTKIVEVNTEAFRAAVEVAEKGTSDASRFVRLDFGPNEITITGKTPELGEAKATVAIAGTVQYAGELSIALDPRYLLAACDAFAARQSELMTFNLIDELSPITFTNGGTFTAVIMPMRLS